MKIIYLGADHAGFALKEKLKKWLQHNRIPHQDLGALRLNPNDDYPDYAAKVGKAVVKQAGSFGVLVCGSAQGVCIAANKIKSVRAVIPFNLQEARLSREHTDANVLCLSGWYMQPHYATKLLHKFIATPFSGEKRHRRRLNKIKKLERKRG